jgi:5-methylcytosine-specific restriction endonuclease McrA
MNRRLRPCLVCGKPSGGAHCPEHAMPRRGWAHERASRQVRLEETSCWICGEPAKPGDPLTGDHIVPRINGGQDVRGNMRAAHRSCNSRRGAGVGGPSSIEEIGTAAPDPATPTRDSFAILIFR